jgi:hypothetical protein
MDVSVIEALTEKKFHSEHKVWLDVHYDNLISVFYFHSMMSSLIGIEVFLSI